MWREFVKDNIEGEEIMDRAFIEEIHARLAHLTSSEDVSHNFVVNVKFYK